MGVDTKWIVGTGIGIVAGILTTGIGLAALMVSLGAGVNARIDDVRGELRDFRTDVTGRFDDVNAQIDDLRGELRDLRSDVNARMASFDTRLRNVEIAFGKVDQRLLIIERFVLPTPEPPAE